MGDRWTEIAEGIYSDTLATAQPSCIADIADALRDAYLAGRAEGRIEACDAAIRAIRADGEEHARRFGQIAASPDGCRKTQAYHRGRVHEAQAAVLAVRCAKTEAANG